MNADLDGADSRWLIAEDGYTAAAGDTITVEKLAAVYTSRDVAAGSVRPACLDELRRHAAAGFAACRERNRAAWLAKWAASDVTIDGDPDAARAVRFNIYHLLIAANESDPRVSIGANSLSGERYRGTRSGTPRCSCSRSSSTRSPRSSAMVNSPSAPA